VGLLPVFYLKKNPLIIRQIPDLSNEIFLTFDDGPTLDTTPLVLDLLKSENWKATFFVIGSQAVTHKSLIQRTLREGHAVMSHSVDHRYGHYFRSQSHLKNWIHHSLEDLTQLTQIPQKSFRPPAGILTPPLVRAAAELNVPLVLWNHRFFDTNSSFSKQKIQKNLDAIRPGDIVLLHDRQSPHRREEFLESLALYLQSLKAKGFAGQALNSEFVTWERTNPNKI
jgi:peptidoglycan/xylan/chitin deacetylase (PgdA/CDA1 family)